MLKKTFLLAMLWLTMNAAQSQTIYYVDASNQQANPNGSLGNPWNGISQVNSASAVFPDQLITIRFRRGQQYYGMLDFSPTAARTQPIVVEAYYNADGTDDVTKVKPVIRNDNIQKTLADLSFTQDGTNLKLYYQAGRHFLYETSAANPEGLRLQTVENMSDLQAGNVFYYYDEATSTYTTYIHQSATADANTVYRKISSPYCIRSNGIKIKITYSNLILKRATEAGLYLSNSSYQTVQNIHITDCPMQGLASQGDAIGGMGSYHLIENCIIDNIGYASTSGGNGIGIFFTDGGTGDYPQYNTVRNCDISSASPNFDSHDHCIYDEGKFNTYYDNYIHGTKGAGIKISNRRRISGNNDRDGGFSCKFSNNIVQNCELAGVWLEETNGCEIIGNTLINSGTTGKGALSYIKNPNPTYSEQNKFLNNIINGCARAMHFDNPCESITPPCIPILVLSNSPTSDYILSDFNVFKNYGTAAGTGLGNYGGQITQNPQQIPQIQMWHTITGNQDPNSTDGGANTIGCTFTTTTAPSTLTNTILDNNLVISRTTSTANGTLQTGNCCAIIKIENGGILEVGNSSVSTLTIHAGTTVTIVPGGKLLIHNNSKVVIEKGAKLLYGKDAIIELDGTDAVLELKGALNIADEADFTFAGSGFIRFGLPGSNGAENLVAGKNSKITLQGGSRTDKVAEIMDNTYLTPGFSGDYDKLFQININTGTVLLGKDAYINARHSLIDFNNANFFASGIQQHGGIIIWGLNSNIADITVDGATMGITKYPGGTIPCDIVDPICQISPLYVSNSTFSNCTIGIYTLQQSANLTNCTFTGNGTGYFADAPMYVPPTLTDCTFEDNYEGVNWLASAGNNFTMNNTTITLTDPSGQWNDFGIRTSGSAKLISRCNTITNNAVGISLLNHSTLNMRWTNATNNGYTIYAGNAYTLELNRGLNDLQPSVEDDKKIVSGTLDGTAFSSAANASIPACNNHWRTDKGMPKNEVDYSLQIPRDNVHLPLFVPVIINDPCPKTLHACNTEPVFICQPCKSVSDNCKGCVAISSKDFVKAKLDDAVSFALAKMSEIHHGCTTDDCNEPGNVIRDDRKAVDLFHQILMFPIPNPIPEEEELLQLAYQHMLEAISNCFLTGQIRRGENSPVFTPEIQMVMQVQDAQISKAGIGEENYFQRLFTTLEKGQILRMADRRELALPIFDNVLTWVKPEQTGFAQRWKCLTFAEQQLLTGAVTHQEFRTLMDNCIGTNTSSLKRMGISKEEPANKGALAYASSALSISPNPTQNELLLASSGNAAYSIRFINLLGQQTFHTTVNGSAKLDVRQWNKGIYFVEIKDNAGNKAMKKIVMQ